MLCLNDDVGCWIENVWRECEPKRVDVVVLGCSSTFSLGRQHDDLAYELSMHHVDVESDGSVMGFLALSACNCNAD
jgi:hypothetical protein